MLQWLVSSGERPKLDPPVGIGSSDQEDDPHHVSLGKIRSRRRRRARSKIHLNPTRSSTDMGSDDDDNSSSPAPGAFRFDEDEDFAPLYELEGCGSMLLEAVSMSPSSHRFSKLAQAQPWKQLLVNSKPTIDPEESSPRKKLLKRMKGLVDADVGSNKLDPLPTEVTIRGSEFDDQVLQEALKMVTENRSLKHHSNLQKIIHESDSSEFPAPRHRRSRPRPVHSRESASRNGSAKESAATTSDKLREQRADYVIDSDNSILQSRTGSDVESSDVSLFQALQRAMQVQRAGRPSPPASPLSPTGPLFDRGPEDVYGAVQSTLDCDLQDDLIIMSRTPRSNRYQTSPTPEKLRTPFSNPKGCRPQPEISPPPRKRRSGPRLHVRSKNAVGESGSEDSSFENDRYATSWNKKQRVVSPTHLNTVHTTATRPRSCLTVTSSVPSPEMPSSVKVRPKSPPKCFWQSEQRDATSTVPAYLHSDCPDLILPGRKILRKTSNRSSGNKAVRRSRNRGRERDQALPGCWKSRQAGRVKAADPEYDWDEEEPSKADIQARRRTGLHKASLVDDSSAFGTTDEEGHKAMTGRDLSRSFRFDASTTATHVGDGSHFDAPGLKYIDISRRPVRPGGLYGQANHRVHSGSAPEESGVPSPVQSIGEPELDILSFLSGDCGGRVDERGTSSTDGGWQPETRAVSSPWSVFRLADTGVSAGLRDESRISPLLVPQRRKLFRPPKPEKRKSRDCNPDLNVLDHRRARESETAKSALGDCDVLSAFSGGVPCQQDEAIEAIHTIPLPRTPARQRSLQPPVPERQQPRDCHPERDDTLPFPIYRSATPSMERSALSHSAGVCKSEQCDDGRALNDEYPNVSKPTAIVAYPSDLIAPGTSNNPIVIGDYLISPESKHYKGAAIEAPCEFFPVSEECACIARRDRGEPITYAVRPGSRQNPIVITDANIAIHSARGSEKSLLQGSVEVNRSRNVHSLRQISPVDVDAGDVGSDRENYPSPRYSGHAKKVIAAEPIPRSFTTGDTSNGGDRRAQHPTYDDTGNCFRDRQVVHTCDPPSMQSRGDTDVSKVGRPADDDCAADDCGVNLGLLDKAGRCNDAFTININPDEHAALNLLQTELDDQLGGAKGIVLFKPRITIYPGSRERFTALASHSRGVGVTADSPAIRESIENVSLAIARLEEKAQQVDFVLSSALEQVNRISNPTNDHDVEDDDGMTAEIDRLSRSEKELWENMNTSQKRSVVGDSQLAAASMLRDNVFKATERAVGPSRPPPLYPVQRLDSLHTVPRRSDKGEKTISLRIDHHGDSPMFPVDLTDVGDARSASSSNASPSSRSSAENRRLFSKSEPINRCEYLYDAIPPLRRIRDQARASHRNTKTRVSSILHLVDPHPDNTGVVQSSTSIDREVDSSVLVLHHRNQDDVEIMCLPGNMERRLEEFGEEIEVIFVEDSFLSTDSFSFGETKGVYFDWKRSAEDHTAEGSTDKSQSKKLIACSPKEQGDPKELQTSIPEDQSNTERGNNEVWREKAVRDMTVGLAGVVGTPPHRIFSRRVQPGIIDEVDCIPSQSKGNLSQRATSDPPGVDTRASQHETVKSAQSRVVGWTEDVRGLEIALPATRSGAFSDVFSGIDDSVRHVPLAVADDSSMKGTLDDDFKRRVDGITRRSERSKRNGVRVLETSPDTKLRADEQSQASSSMMDDEDDESILSLTVSVATKDSVTSNTSLASVASADAEEMLKALLSRGRALISKDPSMAENLSSVNEPQRLEGRQNLGVQSEVTEDVVSTAALQESASEEESEWASSQAVRVAAVKEVKSQPVQLTAEVKLVKIPKAACLVEGKPPLSVCPASRRLARLRRLQDNWTISANGYVVPKQGASSSQVPEPAPKGRYRCAQKRFSKVNSIGEDSCSTLTPSVRRHSDNVTKYMPAIRMSRMLTRGTSPTPVAATSKDMTGTQLATTYKQSQSAAPAKPKKRKSLLGQLHLSKVLSKTMKSISPTAKSKSARNAEVRVESGQRRSRVNVPAASLLIQKKMRSPGFRFRQSEPAREEPVPTSCATETPRAVVANNPFEDLSSRKPAIDSEVFSPPKRRLHLSRIPDFPDLLHPSLRSVVSYPPMSDYNDRMTQTLSSAKSTSPRNLKGLLPSHVRARNVTSALPGSLLWEATHESSDDE